MTTATQAAYAHCRDITRARAKNFYYAFRTLPAPKRRAIYAAYAFCRLCDDIADGDAPVEEKRAALGETRARLRGEAGSGQPNPVFDALGHAIAAYSIPVDLFEEVVDGVEMDLVKVRYDTFEDLREYCFGVASAVGLISIEVFGYEDEAAKEYAIDLGIAMQLTNIMRDLREDAERGRIYLPLEEIDAFGYSQQQLMDGVVNEQFRELMRFQADRARRYFASGSRLMPLLGPRARACPAVLAGVYGALLDSMERAGYDVFQGRIALSTRRKLFIMAKTWAASLVGKSAAGTV